MAKVSAKLDAQMKAKQMKQPPQEVVEQLSLKALEQFVISDSINIVEDTDYSEGGTIGRKDLDSAREETEHEYDILSRIQQSKGFSLGERVKNVKLEFADGLSVERVVTVYEAVVAMPLHPGKDIQHNAHKDKYSYGSITFAQLASTLCTNLELLHDNNIIHSDLKPANIIWDPETAQANIVDFNRAKLISDKDAYVIQVTPQIKHTWLPIVLQAVDIDFLKRAMFIP